VAFWLLNGVNSIDYVIPDVAAPGADWVIVGTGYSNRDGERDIFWQQRSTGTLAVWWRSATAIQGASLLSASPGDSKWRAVAVADLDGDAYSDLIFQHAAKWRRASSARALRAASTVHDRKPPPDRRSGSDDAEDPGRGGACRRCSGRR
jgi:hypothetical protein